MNINLGRSSGEIVAYRIDGALAIYDYTNEDEFDIGHVVMSNGKKAGQAPLMSILAHGYWSDDLSAVMNPFTVRKHQAGKHDQKLHGSWANQMGSEGSGSESFSEWGDRAPELIAALGIGPSRKDLEAALIPVVIQESVRESVESVFSYDIEYEVGSTMASPEFRDLSDEQRKILRNIAYEQTVDRYVEAHGTDRRLRLQRRPNVDRNKINLEMEQVYAVTHTGVALDGNSVTLRSQVTESVFQSDGLHVSGKIFNNDTGNIEGNFHRIISTYEGKIVVTHELLEIYDRYQGSGFSKTFNRQAENFYITRGIDDIYVHAALDGGGYAWASAGFDWDYSNHADSVSNVSAWIGDYILKNKTTMPADLLSDLRSLRTRLGDSPVSNRDYPTPKEIADFGRIDGAETWPGKEIMMGSNWFGKKTLRPEGARISATQAFENASAEVSLIEPIPGMVQ